MENLTSVIADFSSNVKSIGNSIGKLIVFANSENEAFHIAESWLENEEENGQKGLGIVTESYFEEDGKYYFAIVNI